MKLNVEQIPGAAKTMQTLTVCAACNTCSALATRRVQTDLTLCSREQQELDQGTTVPQSHVGVRRVDSVEGGARGERRRARVRLPA